MPSIIDHKNAVAHNGASVPNLCCKFHVLFFLLCAFSMVSCAKRPPQITTITPPSEKFIILYLKRDKKDLEPITINGRNYYPLEDFPDYVQYGKASWYGKKFHGRLTSSGEIYNMYRKTAAHKTLPLGVYVKVINQENGKQTIVKINDRGPFVKGRIIDLSYSAAKEIGLVGPGVSKVKLIVLGEEVGKWSSPSGDNPIIRVADVISGAFTVQVGAFKSRKNAFSIADRLRVIFPYVEIKTFKQKERETLYRVRVSRVKTLKEADNIKRELEKMGFEGAFTVGL